jgi:hypothetical protein
MKVLLGIAGGLVAVCAGLLGWMGAFSQVRVQELDMGPYPFVYVQYAGTEFSRIGELTEALGARLQAAGFTARKPAQIYYPQGRGIQNQIGFVVDRAVGPEVLGTDSFFRSVPATRSAVARFPFRNPLSYVVGHYRVDAALREYRREKGYEERYAMVILEGDTIAYLQPVSGG